MWVPQHSVASTQPAFHCAQAKVCCAKCIRRGECMILAALLVLSTVASVLTIDGRQIDYDRSRGGREKELFHAANAAVLPQLSEMLA
jgi:hypothetical protein